MEKTKIKFETVKAKEIVFGNNFLEIAKRKALGEDGERPFISLTRGYYMENEEKESKDRVFKQTVTLPDNDENVKNFVRALKDIVAS
jgi:hypothetical protein